MIKAILVHCVSIAFGLVVGATVFGSHGSDLQTSQQGSNLSTGDDSLLSRFQPVQATASLDALQMRSMLREELGAALNAALATAGGSSRSAPAPASIVTTSVQQQQEAMRTANEIIASGQWGENERMSFHQQLAQLDPAQAEQAMQTLVRAIDNGSLQVTTEGPPL